MINTTTSKIELFYLGKSYTLEIRFKQKSIVELEDKFYVASTNIQSTKRYLTSWYKQEARKIIQQRVNYYSKFSGSRYNTMSISEAQTRWGSCSSQKNLHFNWRLIMAPIPVIDYVVSHELAHLTEMNHSKLFWEKVRRMFPIYRQYRTWLKRNGESLAI
jgi:predicted metal-dependent hydrolase